MVKISIDSKDYEVKPDQNLLKAILSLGLDIPYFCWHPALGSVGACRQCAVVQFKDENDQNGRIVMSCMTPVTDGLRIGLSADQAREFRAGIIELLMTNHPHDCPVCEEGGECHLQDMTVMSGHTVRQYQGLKRTHNNQYLGPFIKHEMNRCIACYRCVRYYRDYAGGDDLNVFASRNHVYFGRAEDGVLASEFSGNLVEVCPTGVFTDRTFSHHYARKWDLRYAPSICPHCSLGCNISPAERKGELRRIINRYHGEINTYFLCDRGRFGYDFVNGKQRIKKPVLHGRSITIPEAVAHLATTANNRSIAIGSPRASLEANFALRTLVGPEHFYAGLSATDAELCREILNILRNWPVRIPTLRQMESADTVLILGEDVSNTAPRMALTLRQSVRNLSYDMATAAKVPTWLDTPVREMAQEARSPLFVATPTGSRLDDIASGTYRNTPENIARLGFAIARAICAEAPEVSSLTAEETDLAKTIAESLLAANSPLIVSGTGCQSPAVVEAAANIALALHRSRPELTNIALSYVVPEANTLGLAMMDARSVDDVIRLAEADSSIDTLVVLENDLYRRAGQADINKLLSRIKHLVVIDHTLTDTASKAELLLPSGTFAETEGTLVSQEARAQRFFSVMPAAPGAQDAWRWPVAALRRNWQSLDAVTAACAAAFASFQHLPEVAPQAGFRVDGAKVAREPSRYSGRTSIDADRELHEPKPPEDHDSALSYTMEGVATEVPPALHPVYWAPRWNSHQQATTKFQDEAGGHLRGGDPGLRLIEPPEQATGQWFMVNQADPREPGQWQVLPMHDIFASEELSSLSPPIAERAAKPHAHLHPDDVAALKAASRVQIAGHHYQHTLPVQQNALVKPGTIGLPAGIKGCNQGSLPKWVSLNPAGEQE